MESFEGRGLLRFFIFEKLKILKNRIKTWNQEVFGWIDLKVSNEVEKVN